MAIPALFVLVFVVGVWCALADALAARLGVTLTWATRPLLEER